MNFSNFLYTIKVGDTIYKIANEINASSGISVQQIINANPGIQQSDLAIGQQINIPTRDGKNSFSYTVQSGNTLSGIVESLQALRGISVQEIQAANPSIHPEDLRIGQLIRIPTKLPDQTEIPRINNPPVNNLPENRGYWHWTYAEKSNAPEATTIGLAFSGYVDPKKALEESKKVLPVLKGKKFICLGGGNDFGKYTADAINSILDAINSNQFSDYQGIAFDVELGDANLESNFKTLFETAKQKGFLVLVTVSHSEPYGVPHSEELMQSFLASQYIDYLSPQLYTTGKEKENKYEDSGTKWSAYTATKASIIPSIVKASYYPSVVDFFLKKVNIQLKGYIQWQQN